MPCRSELTTVASHPAVHAQGTSGRNIVTSGRAWIDRGAQPCTKNQPLTGSSRQDEASLAVRRRPDRGCMEDHSDTTARNDDRGVSPPGARDRLPGPSGRLERRRSSHLSRRAEFSKRVLGRQGQGCQRQDAPRLPTSSGGLNMPRGSELATVREPAPAVAQGTLTSEVIRTLRRHRSASFSCQVSRGGTCQRAGSSPVLRDDARAPPWSEILVEPARAQPPDFDGVRTTPRQLRHVFRS